VSVVFVFAEFLNKLIDKLKLAMVFIKIGHIVINTKYIAAIKLETYSGGKTNVFILMATPKYSFLNEEVTSQNPYEYEQLCFTGKEAEVLQDYFSRLNNVIGLLP
jgi:hypothetical protein